MRLRFPNASLAGNALLLCWLKNPLIEIHSAVPQLPLSVRLSSFSLPFKQALLAAARVGATGIEIDARNELRPSDLTVTAKRQILKLLDDLNLRVSSVRFPTRRGYDVAADLERRIEATRAAMTMAYELGASHVINQIGRVHEEDSSPSREQLRQSVEDLAGFGARAGAFLTAETGTESGKVLNDFLDNLADHFVPVAFNPGLLITEGFDPHESLKELGDKVGIVVAQDSVQDFGRRRAVEVPVGQGTADFPQILGSLEDHQFRGWFVVGRPGCGEREVADAISYLNQM